MDRKLVLAAALSVLALCGGPVADAQAAGDAPQPQATWEMLRAPFTNARNYVVDFFKGEEEAAARAVLGFADTLRNDLDRFEALVGEAGYSITEIAMDGSLIPSIALTLDFQRDISDEEEKLLRAKLDQMGGVLGAMDRTLILALLDADEAIESIRPNGYALSEVEIDVDLIPGFLFTFAPGEGG